MKNYMMLVGLMMAMAWFLNAQETEVVEGEKSPQPSYGYGSDDSAPAGSIETESAIRPESPAGSEEVAEAPKTASLPMIRTVEKGSSDEPDAATASLWSRVQWNATVDMQVDKEMWDEFYDKSKSHLQTYNLIQTRRRTMVDDFWLRVALRAKYKLQNFESAFALRFYPYWTLRREGTFQQGEDLDKFLDVLEINQAYLKAFKDYKYEEKELGVFFKVGRDGLLTTGSQLFGNYLELPTGGYGEATKANVTGPFKNRKVFANMMEVGCTFKLGDIVSGNTSLMIGGNFNNKKWYSAGSNPESELMDSKLTAGFSRAYQDLYFLKDFIHVGGGYRVYTTYGDKKESRVTGVDDTGAIITEMVTVQGQSKYINGEWGVDVTFTPQCKLYTEFGFQKLGVGSTTGVIRPFTAGITIPTGNVLDLLAIEIENVSDTYFNCKSMRDQVGNREGTESFAWGVVTEKWLLKDRVSVAWGVYTGSAYGDMKTSFRLTSNFD